jgi:hypothetical protein
MNLKPSDTFLKPSLGCAVEEELEWKVSVQLASRLQRLFGKVVWDSRGVENISSLNLAAVSCTTVQVFNCCGSE